MHDNSLWIKLLHNFCSVNCLSSSKVLKRLFQLPNTLLCSIVIRPELAGFSSQFFIYQKQIKEPGTGNSYFWSCFLNQLTFFWCKCPNSAFCLSWKSKNGWTWCVLSYLCSYSTPLHSSRSSLQLRIIPGVWGFPCLYFLLAQDGSMRTQFFYPMDLQILSSYGLILNIFLIHAFIISLKKQQQDLSRGGQAQ